MTPVTRKVNISRRLSGKPELTIPFFPRILHYPGCDFSLGLALCPVPATICVENRNFRAMLQSPEDLSLTTPLSGKVVLITGASSGIGRACAEHLHAAGYRVYGASRRSTPTSAYRSLSIDITDHGQVEQGVATILREAGAIDVLVNCAGSGIAGPVEETPLADAQAQLDVNFFGAVRVTKAVLPGMRERRDGCIVNVSSLMGLVALPFQAYYSASKFALEGWSEALRMEVAPFGIRVALIEPGDFRTGFTDAARRTGAATGSPYEAACTRAIETMEKSERGGAEPRQVAVLLHKIVKARSPRLRYAVGPWYQCWGVAARHVLPARLFEWGVRKVAGV